MRRSGWIAVAAMLVLVAIPAAAFAEDAWPSRPVKMIVPFAPGGASDFVARILQHPLTEILGQALVVDNRAGASGNIGLDVAAKAAPDGYTIFLGNIGTIAINPGVFKSMPVDTQRDLLPVTLVAEVPSILVAHPGLDANNVAELVKLAKSKPGALNFASPGASTLNRLEMEQFMKDAGISIMHIPYKGGAGPAVTGLLGGETQLMFVTLSSAIAFVQAGRLKAFAVTSAEACRRTSQRADDGGIGIRGHGEHLVARRLRSRGDATQHRAAPAAGAHPGARASRREAEARAGRRERGDEQVPRGLRGIRGHRDRPLGQGGEESGATAD